MPLSIIACISKTEKSDCLLVDVINIEGKTLQNRNSMKKKNIILGILVAGTLAAKAQNMTDAAVMNDRSAAQEAVLLKMRKS